jgi:DNA-binding protein HU-beta
MQSVSAVGQSNAKKAFAAGVKVAFGTDAAVYPHGLNAHEFAVYVRLGMTPLQAIQTATLNASDLLADTAVKETKKSGVFVIPGLGRLVKAHRKARTGRNPQTGEPIQIKAKTVVKFRVAKAAKDAIAPKK